MSTPVRRRGSREGVRGTGGRPVRVRSSRWRWVPVLVMSLVTAVVLVLYFTPVLAVKSVRVEGAATVPESEVIAAAQVPLGEPMLQVDPQEARSRLETMPKVASAEVSLSWPSTVVIRVAERTAAAFLRQPTGFELVDASGVPFTSVGQQPEGLPELRLARPAQDDPATRAAMTVLRSLTPEVRSQVLAVEARSWTDVHVWLAGNRQVQWGDPTGSQRKAAILPPLLTRPGTLYDVSSPELPTVS